MKGRGTPETVARSSRPRDVGFALASCAVLGAYNNVINRHPWHHRRYVALNACATGATVAAAVPATRPVLNDKRITSLDGRAVAYQAVVRIPIGTVLWEETAFRGVLQAALRRILPETAAIAATSAVFGLWHIRPTLQALRVNGLANDRRQATARVAVGVAATAVGGALLSWLRARSGGLTAPVLLHLATNSGGQVAAWAVASLGRAPDE